MSGATTTAVGATDTRAAPTAKSRAGHALGARAGLLAIAGLTAIAFAIRLSNFDQGLFGDELSTAWIVDGHTLGHVLRTVYSDAELNPPLFFGLAWLTAKIGSNHEWLRLSSLIAGTATIPIVYATGVRTVGRGAGLVGATVCTLSGMMIYYSTEARSYAVMMACVAASTLAMLIALDTGRRRWWVAYGALSCLAIYSHYTAGFPLAAQLVWLLWTQRDARVAGILATLGAAIAYIPWIPGYIADLRSATVPIISSLYPFTLQAGGRAAGQWALGYPYTSLHQVPGIAFAALIGIGVAIAAYGAVSRTLRSRGWPACLTRIPKRVVLVGVLALSTPVGEAIYSALGTHVLGTRNMLASWPGLALGLGAVVVAAGPVLGVGACLLVLIGYGSAAVKSLESRWRRPDHPGVARFIERQAGPSDVVVDAATFPVVVPLTGLDAYLSQTHREFRLDLPAGPPPYTPASPIPSPARLGARALEDARQGRIFVVTAGGPNGTGLHTQVDRLKHDPQAGPMLRELPSGYRVVEARSFTGLEPLTVLVIDGPALAG